MTNNDFNFSGLNTNIYEIFNDIVNVLAVYNLLDYDQDMSVLENILLESKKKVYSASEKYIFIHYDLDFYVPNCPYGFTIYNLIKLFTFLDIPLCTIILLTNHKGIDEDLKKIIPENEWDTCYPTIIDDIMVSFHQKRNTSIKYAKDFNIKSDVQNIKYNAISLLGEPRSHRNAIYNFIKDNNLLQKIMVSYNNTKL